ncbi:MAG: hypothetical protein J6K88_00305 [Oscillospiraceae bacterium]|nr:hypothetical protein [Oscillospiraceae bacterium]
MEVMSKAQECLIKCLRISGMTFSQIIKMVDLLWEEEATMEFLEWLYQNQTLDQAELYSIALRISEKYKNVVV